MAPTLGYWNMRGYGEPIRYLFHYAGVEFVDKRYDQTTNNAWESDKFNLGLEFPNLPYLIDGDIRVSQSIAILRHFARKHNLVGRDEAERVRVELAEQQIIDLRTQLVGVAYSTRIFEQKREDLIKAIPSFMKVWSKFLGNSKFLVGDRLTYVDFLAYDTFDFYEIFLPTVYDDYPNIKEYLRRFENIPQLKNYLKSPEHKRWPMFRPIAHFGGSGSEPPKRP